MSRAKRRRIAGHVRDPAQRRRRPAVRTRLTASRTARRSTAWSAPVRGGSSTAIDAPPSADPASTCADIAAVHPRPRPGRRLCRASRTAGGVLLDRRSRRRPGRLPRPAPRRTGPPRRTGRAPSRQAAGCSLGQDGFGQHVGGGRMHLPESAKADPPVPAGRALGQVATAAYRSPRAVPARQLNRVGRCVGQPARRGRPVYQHAPFPAQRRDADLHGLAPTASACRSRRHP